MFIIDLARPHTFDDFHFYNVMCEFREVARRWQISRRRPLPRGSQGPSEAATARTVAVTEGLPSDS